MHEFKIIDRGESVHRLKRFTFTVDGHPSLYFSSTKRNIERVIDRLKLGRSSEAFGGAGTATFARSPILVKYASLTGEDKPARGKVIAGGEVTTETVETKSGRTKPREKRPSFLFELDGKVYDGNHTSEAEARGACAIAAFMTRGKLGLKDEARAAFKDERGKDCKIHLVAGKLVAKDTDGKLWWVGVTLGAPLTRKYRFKAVLPELPVALGCEVGAGLRLKEKV